MDTLLKRMSSSTVHNIKSGNLDTTKPEYFLNYSLITQKYFDIIPVFFVSHNSKKLLQEL